MKSDLRAAVAQIAADRGLTKEIVQEVLDSALKAAYRRSSKIEAINQKLKIDWGGDELRVVVVRTVVEDVEDENTEISLEEARQKKPNSKLGDDIDDDQTPKDFGRIAAQTTKQVLLQGFRERERDHVFDQFVDREGDIVNGTIQRIDAKGITIELEPRAEALMPPQEQVPSERYRTGQKIKVFLLEVQKSHRGPQLIVSRTHRNLLRRLFEIEVPEIYTGSVEIKSIAREPGLRSKVAVAARQDGVDPVGSCVGMRGVRIQNIVNELYGEKIDVLPWDADMSRYIANALSPAQVVNVELDENEKSALVLVPQNQLSLAIGKEGQNARLAAKLTGWRIDIKPVTAGSAVAAANSGYGGGRDDDDAFARMARAAMSRERDREAAADQTLNASFAQAARAAGISFDEESNRAGNNEDSPVQAGELRKIRGDGTFTYKGVTLGPLPPHLADTMVKLVDNGRNLFVMVGDELIRAFRAEEYEGGEEDEAQDGGATGNQARETRKVRKDGMVVFRNQTFGPLEDRFIGQTIELELNSDHLDIYKDEELIDSFLWAD